MGLAVLIAAGFLLFRGAPMSVPRRIVALRTLSLAKMVALRDVRVAVAEYEEDQRHNLALSRFVGLVVGGAVGVFTLNIKAGVAAMTAATKLTSAIQGAPSGLKPALVLFKKRMEGIAALENTLGLPPGITVAEVNALRYALESTQPGYVPPSAPPRPDYAVAIGEQYIGP